MSVLQCLVIIFTFRSFSFVSKYVNALTGGGGASKSELNETGGNEKKILRDACKLCSIINKMTPFKEKKSFTPEKNDLRKRKK